MEMLFFGYAAILFVAGIPLFVLNNKRKEAKIIAILAFFCVLMTGVFAYKEQQSQDKEYMNSPVSHITIQDALEKGEHLYRRDSITGAMVHSQDCPNPLDNDLIRKED